MTDAAVWLLSHPGAAFAAACGALAAGLAFAYWIAGMQGKR